MMFLQFADKSVPYGVFVKDVAAEVAVLLQQFKDDPEYISQNKAFAIFGRVKSLPASVRVKWNTARQTCDCSNGHNRTTYRSKLRQVREGR